MSIVIETPRLFLREWTDDDLPPFAALNADPEVMEHLPTTSPADSDAMAMRIRTLMAERGYGLWAVEVRSGAPFIGFVGLAMQTFEAHFTPAVEIGWRLSRAHWGKGYAIEAARAAMRFGFETLRLEQIVSMTVPANVRSRRVMERLGMKRNERDDFDHPKMPEGHRLRRHVLYRIDARDFLREG